MNIPKYHRCKHEIVDKEHGAILKYEYVVAVKSDTYQGNAPEVFFNDYLYTYDHFHSYDDMIPIKFYHLKYISVSKEYRRQGYGTKLLKQLISKAEEDDIPIILMVEHCFRCGHCKTVYDTEEEASKCGISHIPATVSDILKHEYNAERFKDPRIPEGFVCRIHLDDTDRYGYYRFTRFVDPPDFNH